MTETLGLVLLMLSAVLLAAHWRDVSVWLR